MPSYEIIYRVLVIQLWEEHRERPGPMTGLKTVKIAVIKMHLQKESLKY